MKNELSEIRERTIRALSERGVNYTIDPHTGRAEVFNIKLSDQEVLALLQNRARTNSQSPSNKAKPKHASDMTDQNFNEAVRRNAWRNR